MPRPCTPLCGGSQNELSKYCGPSSDERCWHSGESALLVHSGSGVGPGIAGGEWPGWLRRHEMNERERGTALPRSLREGQTI
jgi:hypothetical protein